MRIFKGEDPRETILRDRKRSGRPLSASDTAHREKVDCMVRANRRVKQKEIADEVGISKERECKAQSMEYRHKTSPSPRKFKVVASARKVLFTVFWDMEGVVHMEFLEQGQTVNSERYISTLRALKLRLRRIRRDKDSILQHDNARPHTSRQTQDALRQLELTTLPHPAYSPDLAPL